MYKENELVIYGSTGVCRVVKIGLPEFSDDEERLYYFLEPLYQAGIIYAPVDNEAVSMRPVISADEASDMLDSIDGIQAEPFKDHSMQQLSAHYQSIIDTHNCIELLTMAKSIYLKSEEASRNNKRLGQIDKRFMKRAEELLYGEFAVALNADKDEIQEYVHRKFAQ